MGYEYMRFFNYYLQKIFGYKHKFKRLTYILLQKMDLTIIYIRLIKKEYFAAESVDQFNIMKKYRTPSPLKLEFDMVHWAIAMYLIREFPLI